MMSFRRMCALMILLQTTFIKDSHGQTVCQDLDLTFLIDRSGSICDADKNFDYLRDTTCNNWNFIVQFVYRIADSLVIGPSNTRVALAIFSSSSSVLFNLNAYTDKSSLLAAINSTLVYLKGGTTDTVGGLRLLTSQIFTPSNNRPNYGKTTIIITDGRPTGADGRPTDRAIVQAAIDDVHNAQITTLVVGVTDAVDNSTLKQLSSDPQQAGVTYFWATDFSTIDQLREQLRNQTCSLPPLQSTVSQQSTTTPVISIGASSSTAQPNSQTDCSVMDVCLVLDRSGSICDSDREFLYQRDETCMNWKSLVAFVHGLANSFNIGPNNVRVALVLFSNSAEVGWGLNNYTDKASLLAAIDGLQYIKGGTTDTTGGLNLVNTRIFNAGVDRPNAAKLAIIFTDGKPTVPSTVDGAVQAVHASNIKTMCVGVTDSIDEPTLKSLSSPPQQLGITYFMAANFSTINVVSEGLQRQVCPSGSTTTSGPVSCGDAIDLVIVLDGSGSICDADPNFSFPRDETCRNWMSIIQFVSDLISGYTIGSSATRVAFVLFSSDSRMLWGLNAYTDKTALLYAIKNVRYVKGGTTDTAGALNVVKDQVFTPQMARPNAAKMAIIVTDGKPTNPSAVQPAIDGVQALGVRTYAVGVTNQIDNRTLIQLASPPKAFGVTIFIAVDYQTIGEDIRRQLLAQSCPGSTTTGSPTSVTTASTPASSTPTSLGSTATTSFACASALDLCFLVDGSGSICDSDPGFNYSIHNTCNNWNLTVQFIARIVQTLAIGPNQIRVAMVTFASESRVLWTLPTYASASGVLSAVNNMTYSKGGTTDTTGGLDLMRTQIFATTNRPNVEKTAIIITDGKPTNTSTVQRAVDQVHQDGIRTVVVGVTSEIDEQTLKQLSSPPQQLNVTYFIATGFDTLETIRSILTTEACGQS